MKKITETQKSYIMMFFSFLSLIAIIVVIFSYQSYNFKFKKDKSLPNQLKIESNSFINNGYIPHEFTCDGADVNPSISFSGLPDETKSLALIVKDPDAPAKDFIHWKIWNIPPTPNNIKMNNIPKGAIEGENDFGKIGYSGPCPPTGTHHYVFTLYALNTMINDKNITEEMLTNSILDKATLIGLYTRE